MPRRDVSMSPSELRSLLQRSLTAVLTTLERDGWPHSTAMWFVPDQDSVRMWTYGKSQKAVNLKRDPRCALVVEEGSDYGSLRGACVQSEVRVVDDFDSVSSIGRDLYLRYTFAQTGIPYEDGPRVEVERQARKRIGLEVPLTRVTSWDHTKL